ncbi:MAG: lipid-A-disaccharide synthase [Pseudomonadota bacterium]
MSGPKQDPGSLVLLAGEASGDRLGAELTDELRRRFPDLKLAGVGGERMRAAGVDCWHDCQELAVMGFAEVFAHLPRLLKLRRGLTRRLLSNPPAAFVGIDAPDFNLGLARRLKARGVPTVQYVSPSIWAWRQGRAAKIGRCVDLVLTLFPFEPAIYQQHGVPARFVGHPSAHRLPLEPDITAARQALDLVPDRRVVALLPGSRMAEIKRLGNILARCAKALIARYPDLQLVTPTASDAGARLYRDQLATAGMLDRVVLAPGRSFEALTAADAAIVASGTATLEALLCKTPMVVTYRVSPVSLAIVRALRMMKVDQFSLPNALADEQLVPELMQNDATPEKLVAAVVDLLDNEAMREATVARFTEIHQSLRADLSAAQALEEFLDLSPGPLQGDQP